VNFINHILGIPAINGVAQKKSGFRLRNPL